MESLLNHHGATGPLEMQCLSKHEEDEVMRPMTSEMLTPMATNRSRKLIDIYSIYIYINIYVNYII